MKLKKHIPPEGHVGYAVSYPLFEPLLLEELEAITGGADAYRARFPGRSLFPDPFFQPDRPSRNYPLTTLKIVAGEDLISAAVAAELVSRLREMWNLEIPVYKVGDLEASLDSTAPLLLIGGANLNRLSMQIAKQYQIGLFCAEFPRCGGWGVTTHWELEGGMPPRYILVASGLATMPQVIRAFLDHAIEGSISPSLKWVHQVSSGSEAFELAGDFDTWIARRTFTIPEVAQWIESGCSKPYREVFKDFYQQDFSTILPYNAELVDLGIDAIRYYQSTGDSKAFELFREMMWGFWNYLINEDPQVYISDLDFRLGILCNHWNWIEHHPLITPEERHLFPKLLLGAMRMAGDYFRFRWKHRPGPHNHQTFKARTLIQGWRYFKRWDIPDLQTWKDDADGVFEAINLSAFKHRENANHYERFVPEHTLVWMEVSGREMTPEFRSSLVQFAKREWSMLDPFLSPVDYGDSEATLTPCRPLRIGPWLLAESAEEVELLHMEQAGGEMLPCEFPSPIASFTGIGEGSGGKQFSGQVGWSVMPLDPLLEEKFPLFGHPASRFDKLTWREAWTPEAAYLAIEGFGNTTVSHAHNEANGVLRMNLAGRIWLVSNGYGKSAAISDAATAFRKRQRGPEEHNMLVVRTNEGNCVTPPVNAVLRDLRSDPIPVAVTEIADYGGFRWRRHTIHLPNIGIFFVDQVKPLCPEAAASSVEIQWNLLGKRLDRGDLRLSSFEQNGVTLVFDHFGTGKLQWEESQIAGWRKLIEKREYPHTESMPTHCILKGEGALGNGSTYYFVSGFWLQGSVQHHSWDADTNTLQIGFSRSLNASPSIIGSRWGRINLQAKVVAINFQD